VVAEWVLVAFTAAALATTVTAAVLTTAFAAAFTATALVATLAATVTVTADLAEGFSETEGDEEGPESTAPARSLLGF
jgi:hypothetical protein